VSRWNLEGITVHATQNGRTYAIYFDGSQCDTQRDMHDPDESVVTIGASAIAEQLDLEDMGGEYGN